MLLTLTVALVCFLAAWRWKDKRADLAVWKDLASHQPSAPDKFDPSMIADLPDPAQRYFRFAIAPGTPLYSVAEIYMEGELALGTKTEPNYMPMHAEQILAAPYGFVWKLRAGNAVSFAGSDGASNRNSWSRFWLVGILPIARAGNNEDHARSAFGRYVAEAVFWSPAVLLMSKQVQWETVDDSTVRVVVKHMELEQAVELSVDAYGKLDKVMFQRWSNANPTKTFQLQPFGGYLSGYENFGGFRLPTRIEAGNFFGTDDYFPFYVATVTSVRFPAGS